MKKLIQIITLFCTLNSFSQTIIKVETYDDDEKNKYFSPHLIDENNEWDSLGFQDENGFFNLKHLKLDSLKTYRLYLDDSRFIKIDNKLNLKINDTLIVKLKPNPNCNCKTFPKDVFVKNCPFYETGSYKPLNPRRLDELPINISQNVKNYLLSRVGEKFYKKIYFKEGKIIDSIFYKRHNMETRYLYILCFAFSNIEKGIGEYTANIEVDEFGKIITNIDLPKNTSTINKLVSLKETKKKAIIRKFYVEEKTKIELIYDESKNILVWKFTNEEYKSNNTYIQKTLTYNAHNGKYLDLNVGEGQWIE
jgi:hypothetical protein